MAENIEGYSLIGEQRNKDLPEDFLEHIQEADEVSRFGSISVPEDEFTEPATLHYLLTVLSNINGQEKRALIQICELAIQEELELGTYEHPQVADFVLLRLKEAWNNNCQVNITPYYSIESVEISLEVRKILEQIAGGEISPYVARKYLNDPSLVNPDFEKVSEIIASGEVKNIRQIAGASYSEQIHLDKGKERNSTLFLERADYRIALNDLLPPGAIFFRSNRQTNSDAPFEARANFNPESEFELESTPVVLFGQVDGPSSLFALFHEIGHLWADIRFNDKQLSAINNSSQMSPDDREKLLNEIYAERERTANAWAIRQFRKIRQIFTDDEAFSDRSMITLAQAQLFRKHLLPEGSDFEYHPYLRSKVRIKRTDK